VPGNSSSQLTLLKHTEQTMTYFLNGSELGAGVLYRMLVTASSALGARGCEKAGNGGGALRLLESLSDGAAEGKISSRAPIFD
jgi:hypothetical protein